MPDFPCDKCGYNLNGLPALSGQVQCPECGECTDQGFFGRRKLPLKSWLIALVIGASPMLVILVIAVTMTSHGSGGDFNFLAFLFLFILGPLTAAYFGFRIARTIGIPLSSGPWQSRAWTYALVTGIDSFFFNLCVVVPALLILVMLLAR